MGGMDIMFEGFEGMMMTILKTYTLVYGEEAEEAEA